jgi:uncharacterized cupredoxin-like copper-binding protein
MQGLRRTPRRTKVVLILAVVLGSFAGCGYVSSVPPSGSGSVQTVRVTLADFKIHSSLTTFKVGTTYHFVVKNSGHTDHEWMLAPPMMSNMPMEQMHNMALMHVDMVHPGQTETMDYTFHQMPMTQQGSLEMACHFTGHYEAGMKLPITVE